MALDEATREFVEKGRRNATKPRHLMTPQEARALLSGIGSLLGRAPEMERIERRSVAVAGGEIEVRLLVPHGELRALIVYFHGGGWVVGSNDEFEPSCRHLAAKSGCAVAMVSYRKAPEHRFPIPLDDATTGFDWVMRHGTELVGKSLPVVIAGDSAGGNLAAVVALRERDSGKGRIAAQLLVYPVTDADFERPSYSEPDNQAMLTREVMIGYWDHYLPDADRRSEANASPLRAGDLSGLPPAIIITAEHDVLRDEGEAYAQRLRQEGVKVVLRRFEGQIHGFMLMYGLLPGCIEGLDFAARELVSLLEEHRAV